MFLLSDLKTRLIEALWRTRTPAGAIDSRSSLPVAAPVINTITCPHCSAALPTVMEEDACVIFMYCPKCHEKIEMRQGDCCVFRSYGESPCPHPIRS